MHESYAVYLSPCLFTHYLKYDLHILQMFERQTATLAVGVSQPLNPFDYITKKIHYPSRYNVIHNLLQKGKRGYHYMSA